MARYVTSVRTDLSVADAFAYMADLRNFAEWDPGVRRVVQIEGTGGGPSSIFDVTVASTTLRYRTMEHTEPTVLVVIAESAVLVSTDRVTVRPDGNGSIVRYDADLRLKGLANIFSPALALAFRRIGDRAAAGLRAALDGVAVAS